MLAPKVALQFLPFLTFVLCLTVMISPFLKLSVSGTLLSPVSFLLLAFSPCLLSLLFLSLYLSVSTPRDQTLISFSLSQGTIIYNIVFINHLSMCDDFQITISSSSCLLMFIPVLGPVNRPGLLTEISIVVLKCRLHNVREYNSQHSF